MATKFQRTRQFSERDLRNLTSVARVIDRYVRMSYAEPFAGLPLENTMAEARDKVKRILRRNGVNVPR